MRWTAGLTNVLLVSLILGTATQVRAQGITVKQLIESYRPMHEKDLEFETPTAAQYAKCKIETPRNAAGKPMGWEVTGPEGQLLRRFIDTNGDGEADQFGYFNLGIEVYRDLDTNGNNKIDQSRWINLGGARWAIDANEDKKIDGWKILSAAEASRVAIRALATGDEDLLRTLMISKDDLRELGIVPEVQKSLLQAQTDLAKNLKTASKSKVISPQTKWMKFDAQSPGLIPVDERKATGDLQVYENAMAIVDNAGQSGLVQIGEMIRVGEVWKLAQCPKPLEGTSVEMIAGGVLMQPLAAIAGTAVVSGGGPSPESQKLLDDLQKLDLAAPQIGAPKNAVAQYNAQRIELLTKLISAAQTAEEKEQAMRQMVDGVAASVQAGQYPEGLESLKKWEASLKKSNPKSPLVPYTLYRRMMSEYSQSMQSADDNEKRSEVQKGFLKSLEEFVAMNATSDDAGDAMMQLASSEELAGDVAGAKKWYTRLAKEKSESVTGQRGAGALRRLDLQGKPLQLAGPGFKGGKVDLAQYRGKTVLVLFWTTWCQPCIEDLPQLRAMYQQYQSKGFEVVGVCLDVNPNDVDNYIKQNKVTWPQIYEPGGFDSGMGAAYGIITVPTMFLVDGSGKVVSHAATLADVKSKLPTLLAAKP